MAREVVPYAMPAGWTPPRTMVTSKGALFAVCGLFLSASSWDAALEVATTGLLLVERHARESNPAWRLVEITGTTEAALLIPGREEFNALFGTQTSETGWSVIWTQLGVRHPGTDAFILRLVR